MRGLKRSGGLISSNASGSHLTWVRGLKLNDLGIKQLQVGSHLTWVRGLKPVSLDKDYFSKSRTLRGCVG